MSKSEIELEILPQYFGMSRGEAWEQSNRPILVLDGRSHSWDPDVKYKADDVFIVGVNDTNFGNICQSLTAKTVYFYEARVVDVSPTNEIIGLQKLAINWNSKVSDLGPLSGLADLEALDLVNTPKATDLSFFGTAQEPSGL